MADRPPPAIPKVLRQPTSVDFIENRLPEISEGFKNLPIRYDPVTKRFVLAPERQVAAMTPSHWRPGFSQQRHPLPDTTGRTSDPQAVSLRKLPPAIGAMGFWDRILERAKKRHRQDNPDEPKKLVEQPEYSIRHKENWDDIHERLQRSRVKFDGTKTEFWGRLKKVYRSLADHTAVANQALKLIPDHEFVSPAGQVASATRKRIKEAIDGEYLADMFSKVEIFLATFPKDENIVERSVNLVACILNAIEQAIAYFLSRTSKTLHTFPKVIVGMVLRFICIVSRFTKALTAATQAHEYQQPLIDSIDEVQVKSQKLIEEAQTSHIAGTSEAIHMILEGIEQVTLLELKIGDNVEYVIEKTDRILEQGGQILLKLTAVEDMVNEIKSMFDDGNKKRDQLIYEQSQMIQEQQKFIERFETRVTGALEEIRRTATPSPSPLLPSAEQLPLHPPEQLLSWSQPLQLPWQDQPPLQMEYQQQYQQHSLAPPQNACFAPPANHHYFPSPPLEPTIHVSVILAILDISDIDKRDIALIMESSNAIPLKYRRRAKQTILADEFRTWATSATSCELLIQGNPGADTTQATFAMSLVSASLMQGLRNRDRFVSLIFFCGRHVESDDAFSGGKAMIRSLLAQLLQQHYVNATFRQQDVDLEGLRSGDIDVLSRVFRWLVRQLPQHKTLVCVVDAVEYYETAKYEDHMRTVLDALLGLARDETMSPAVKILATSPIGTVSVHKAFKNDDSSFLLMDGLPSRDEDVLELEDQL
ncbi:hypothetical protein FDECE_11146 [Fusarium decemcellulare]|nr:hypothetical protein FDECE_11146 [Fusarium decemcellulare]